MRSRNILPRDWGQNSNCYPQQTRRQFPRAAALDAKKLAARKLIDFRLFQEAYSVIQTIETSADKALPVARLAEGMTKSGHK